MGIGADGKEEVSPNIVRLSLTFQMGIGSFSLTDEIIEFSQIDHRFFTDGLGIGVSVNIKYFVHR